jgi:hypothetical protein
VNTAVRRSLGNAKTIMKKRHVKPRLVVLIVLLLITLAFVSRGLGTNDAFVAEQYEVRCGWFSNPTPANASLYDRDDEWIIGVQGGHQAEGDWPAFGPKRWVPTNGNYGYGCACLRVRVNRETHEVVEIKSSRTQPLAACRRDRSLRRWSFK